MLARQELIKQDSQGEDIGRGGDRFPLNLLGTAIFGRQYDCAGRHVRERILRLLDQFRDSEIEQFYGARSSHQHIAWL